MEVVPEQGNYQVKVCSKQVVNRIRSLEAGVTQQWECSECCLCLHGEVAASEQYFLWELAVGISARNQPQFIQPTGQNQMLLEGEVCVWEEQLSDNLVLRGTSF